MKVFISYSHQDVTLADTIAQLLDDLGIQYFRDIKNINWGGNIAGKIAQGLAECSHLVVVLSPATAKSNWVPYEIGRAQALGLQVLPFLQHPDVNRPAYVHDLLYIVSIEEAKERFKKLVSNPPAANPADLRALSPTAGFIALEPLTHGIFTPEMDANGYKELQAAIEIGSAPPSFDSRVVVKPVRAGGFVGDFFENSGDLIIRVGSPKHFGVERGRASIPLGKTTANIILTLVSEHGWHVAETKQFFVTCGPPSNPTGYQTAPLTIKRMK